MFSRSGCTYWIWLAMENVTWIFHFKRLHFICAKASPSIRICISNDYLSCLVYWCEKKWTINFFLNVIQPGSFYWYSTALLPGRHVQVGSIQYYAMKRTVNKMQHNKHYFTHWIKRRHLQGKAIGTLSPVWFWISFHGVGVLSYQTIYPQPLGESKQQDQTIDCSLTTQWLSTYLRIWVRNCAGDILHTDR